MPRPALFEQLIAPRPDKLTLIAAPPGWGKTTLLSAWQQLERGRRPFVWLSLEAGDNDPARFWTYVLEGLQLVHADIGAEVAGLLRVPRTPLLETFMPALVTDLVRIRPVVLVFDDYHAIQETKIHESVCFLLEHLPPRLHLALATRSDPPLQLARLRARGELLELRTADLRFDEEETEIFLNHLLGLGLERADLGRLHERTEGWAAGLYLAALSLRGRANSHAFVEAFAGDHRHVVDYLLSEVLEREPTDGRSFLLRTSILGRLSGSVCDAVLETRGSAQKLEQLEHSNLFLVPLDTRREWYRYHSLFQDMLLHELLQVEPDLLPDLHRRASAWYRDHDFAPEAIHHALAAGDVHTARDIIVRHWQAFLNLGRLATVDVWLDALPTTVVASDPQLCIARAWLALDRGRLQDVGDWIDTAEESTAASERGLRAETAVLRSVYQFKIGNVDRARRTALATLELAPTDAVFPRTAAHSILGISLYLSGEPDEAVEALTEAIRLARSTGNELVASYAMGYASVIHAESGEFYAAKEAAFTALAGSDEPGFAEHFTMMMAHLGLAKVLASQSELSEAESRARRALELANRGAGRLEIIEALITLAEIRGAQGAVGDAKTLLNGAREKLSSSPNAGTVATALTRAEQGLTMGPVRPHEASAQSLTDRELAVLRLLSTDLSQREIGRELYVSLNTIKTHSKHIFRKLSVSTRPEAVERARELGVI